MPGEQAPSSVLVFDFGTSYFKAGVIGPGGELLALHRIPSPIVTADGRSEMTTAAFESAVRSACHSLRPHLGQVRAVTFSSQANTITLLGEGDRPLTPFMVWNDARAIELDREARAFGEDRDFIHASGLPVLTHEHAPVRLAWLSRRRPEVMRAMRRVQWLADRFTHWLTGRHTVEASVAALSGLLDVPRWRWNPAVCRFAGIDAGALGEIVRSGETIGPILPAVADELGLPRSCRVVAGCLDQYAGAVGVGNQAPGMVSETTGTVLAVVACSRQWTVPGDAAIYRGPGACSDLYFQMSFGTTSANLLEHYRRCLPDAPSFEDLSAACKESQRLHLDEKQPPDELKRTLTAWAACEPRGDVVAALFSAVARSLASHVRRLSPTPPASIRCAGGAARSRRWLQVKADTLGVPMVAPAVDEPALLGAAILAGVDPSVTTHASDASLAVHPRR